MSTLSSLVKKGVLNGKGQRLAQAKAQAKLKAKQLKAVKTKLKIPDPVDSSDEDEEDDMPLAPPLLVRQSRQNNVADIDLDDMTVADIDSSDDESTPNLNLLFISDSKLTNNIKSQLDSYSNCVSWSRDLFTNRSCLELLENHNVQNIWVDIRCKYARAWLSTALVQNDETFSVICVYGHSKCQKWLVDLKSVARMTVKISEISKITSLTMDEMVDNLNSITIHEPLHKKYRKLLGCLGIDSGLLTKKKD